MKIERRIAKYLGPSPFTVAVPQPSWDTEEREELDEKNDCWFGVRTYLSLSLSKGPGFWNAFFEILNRFLATLDETDERRIMAFYQEARPLASDLTPDVYRDRLEAIQDAVARLMDDTDLPKKALVFIQGEDLPYPDLSEVGTRAYDRPEFTFHLPEYKILTALSVLAKMMSPVWGHLIMNGNAFIKTSDKEARCLTTFLPVLDHPVFRETTEKLEAYTKNGIERHFSRNQKTSSFDIKFVLAHQGYTDDYFLQIVYGILFVKKLAQYDPLFILNSDRPLNAKDIMKHISSSNVKTIPTSLSSIQNHASTMPRLEPKSKNEKSESDSVTLLENESFVSRTSVSLPIYVRLGIDFTVDRYLEARGISPDLFRTIHGHYDRSQVTHVSPWAMTILSCLFSRDVGGSRALRYLDYPATVRLMSLAQLDLHLSGVPSPVTHLVTAWSRESDGYREPSDIDKSLRVVHAQRGAWADLLAVYPDMVGARTIEMQMNDCLVFITDHDHSYNTAPPLLELMEEDEIENGTPLAYGTGILADLSAFIRDRAMKEAPHDPQAAPAPA